MSAQAIIFYGFPISIDEMSEKAIALVKEIKTRTDYIHINYHGFYENLESEP